jgi:arylsulfatase A-like enzyme
MTGKWHVAKEMSKNGDKSNWPLQRGFQRHFGTLNGSGSFYDPGTLISNNTFVAPGKDFYYTNAISDTTVKFINQHPKGKPFFFYVAYTAAHWPLHAPENEVRKYKGKYDKGWDAIRQQRFEKLKKLGIIDNQCVLSERGVEIPAWKNEPLKDWQLRRMEVYAAMIDVMDQGVGRIISALDKKGELENTVIFYMQDNGGCAEPQGSDKPEVPMTDEQKILKPFSYDSVFTGKRPIYSRDGRFVRSGRGVMAGDANSWMAYGPEWANVSNTPFRSYKQYVHEGGIASPLIVHWPAGIAAKGQISKQLSHLIDIVPTCLEITGIPYPTVFENNTIQPLEGISLVPAFQSKTTKREFVFWEHSANCAIRVENWKLVSRVKTQKQFATADQNKWELYDMDKDPSETNNLAAKFPEKVKELAQKWETEALRTKAKPWPWEVKNLPVKGGISQQVIDNIQKGTIEQAEKMMSENPVTVTASSCKRSTGGKNDFYSEGDYWWPDPSKPDGPYIQKDGQTNPENFSDHRYAMIRFSDITATLTSAWLLTANRKYADKAIAHLNAWFIDPTTKMNPNMLYAQAIWGKFTGRGIGLIDAYHLVEVAQSAKILIDNKMISKEESMKIRQWFSSFLTWMTTHQYGIDEMNAKNNHGTCWVATAASMAVVAENDEVKKLCINRFKTILLPSQMADDGSFPLEIKRTKPYGYSLFNIDAMCNVARILSTPLDNLFEFKTEKGLTLKNGMEYIYPFIADKSKWPFAKDIYIWEEWPVRQSSLLFAGLAYQNGNYISTFLSLPANPTHPEVIRNLPVRHPIIWLLNKPLKFDQ